MITRYEEAGYVKGTTVRQYHSGTLYDDAVISRVYESGGLDVIMDGVKYGWSVSTCTPVIVTNNNDDE